MLVNYDGDVCRNSNGFRLAPIGIGHGHEPNWYLIADQPRQLATGDAERILLQLTRHDPRGLRSGRFTTNRPLIVGDVAIERDAESRHAVL